MVIYIRTNPAIISFKPWIAKSGKLMQWTTASFGNINGFVHDACILAYTPAMQPGYIILVCIAMHIYSWSTNKPCNDFP